MRQAGYVGHVGQWGPQPVNQGAVFGRRPQEPEEHPGMQQSWASPVTQSARARRATAKIVCF